MLKYLLLFYIITTSVYTDYKQRQVKNKFLLPGVFIGIVYHLIEGGGKGALLSLAGLFIPILVLFPLFMLKMLPAGDIKMIGAIGAIMGLGFVTSTFIYGIFLAGCYAVFIMMKEKIFIERIKYFFKYIGVLLGSGVIVDYNDYSQKNRVHHFALAYFIGAGAIIQMVVIYLGYSII